MAAQSKFTPELSAEICERLANGQSLLTISEAIGVPHPTLRLWEDPERTDTYGDHAANSARARQCGIHKMAEECLEIADDSRNDYIERLAEDGDEKAAYARANAENVQRSRLRIDTRLRLAGKWLPKVYGDKVAVGGDADNPVPVTMIVRTVVAPQGASGDTKVSESGG